MTRIHRSPCRFRRLLAVLAMGACLALPVGAADELRVAFIAYQNPDQLMESVDPVVDYLERRLSVPVKAFAATDYAAVIEALANETADIGFMGPLQVVIAAERAGAYPLLGEIYYGSPTYVSRIFVRKDRQLTSLADLRGKSIAFSDPLSSSGYLYPLDIFKEAGLISSAGSAEAFFKQIYFAGGDEQAMRAVLNGFVDAAGIGQYAFNLLRVEERDQLMVIGESQPIPSHCVVARRGLDQKLAEGFKEALLALNEGPDHGLLKQLYSVDGYVAVDASTYAGVARLAREYDLMPGRK